MNDGVQIIGRVAASHLIHVVTAAYTDAIDVDGKMDVGKRLWLACGNYVRVPYDVTWVSVEDVTCMRCAAGYSGRNVIVQYTWTVTFP